jgi:hypothetical protein
VAHSERPSRPSRDHPGPSPGPAKGESEQARDPVEHRSPQMPSGPSAKGRAAPVVPPYLAAASEEATPTLCAITGATRRSLLDQVRERSSGTSSRTVPDRASTSSSGSLTGFGALLLPFRAFVSEVSRSAHASSSIVSSNSFHPLPENASTLRDTERHAQARRRASGLVRAPSSPDSSSPGRVPGSPRRSRSPPPSPKVASRPRMSWSFSCAERLASGWSGR